MDADERILTQHPDGKQGVRIRRAYYEEMRRALLRVIPKGGEGIGFGELSRLVEPILDRTRMPETTSTQWYVVVVKQDLEARGIIERVSGARPQRLRRC